MNSAEYPLFNSKAMLCKVFGKSVGRTASTSLPSNKLSRQEICFAFKSIGGYSVLFITTCSLGAVMQVEATKCRQMQLACSHLTKPNCYRSASDYSAHKLGKIQVEEAGLFSFNETKSLQKCIRLGCSRKRSVDPCKSFYKSWGHLPT